MNKLKIFISNNKISVLFCLGITLFFCYPLIHDTMIVGHDMLFHLGRIEGLKNTFDLGQVIPKIYPYHNYDFGYAAPLFYSDLFNILPAILYKLGMPLLVSYKWMLASSAALMAFIMFYTTQSMVKNKFAPYISTSLYMLTSYHVIDVYARAAIGEMWALTFVPLVIYSLYRIIVEEKKSWVMLSISMTLMVLSHNISFVLCCLLSLFFSLAYLKKLINNPNIIKQLVFGAIGSLLLAAFFIFPMLEQLNGRDFYLNHIGDKIVLNNYRQTIAQLFVDSKLVGYSNQSYLLTEKMTFNMGPLLIIITTIFPFIVSKIQNADLKKFAYVMFVIGFFMTILTTNLFDWNLFGFLTFIQYPWRFFVIISPLFSYVAAITIINLLSADKQDILTIFVVALATAYFNLTLSPITYPDRIAYDNMIYDDVRGWAYQDPNYGSYYNRNELASAEYLPYTPEFAYNTHTRCITYVDGKDASCNYSKNGNTLFFEISDKTRGSELLLPITYYKGYQLYELDKDYQKTRELEIEVEEDSQTISFKSSKNSSGMYMLEYGGTFIQKSTLYVSFLTLLSMIVYRVRIIIKKLRG